MPNYKKYTLEEVNSIKNFLSKYKKIFINQFPMESHPIYKLMIEELKLKRTVRALQSFLARGSIMWVLLGWNPAKFTINTSKKKPKPIQLYLKHLCMKLPTICSTTVEESDVPFLPSTDPVPVNDNTRKIMATELPHEDDLEIFNQLAKMAFSPACVYFIRTLSIKPFIVHLWTDNQVKWYNNYRSKNFTIMYVESMEDLMNSIACSEESHIGGNREKVILYTGVIYSMNKFIPVTQMITSKYSNQLYQNWLCEWLADGVPPQVVLTEGNLDALDGICKAFNGFSINEYLGYCYENNTKSIKTIIRIHGTYFEESVKQWACIQKMKPVVRNFYLKSICKCTKLSSPLHIKYIFQQLVILASNKYATKVQFSVKSLHEFIKARDNEFDFEKLPLNWFDHLIEESMLVDHSNVRKLNDFFSLDLISRLKTISSTIFLWANILNKLPQYLNRYDGFAASLKNDSVFGIEEFIEYLLQKINLNL